MRERREFTFITLIQSRRFPDLIILNARFCTHFCCFFILSMKKFSRRRINFSISIRKRVDCVAS